MISRARGPLPAEFELALRLAGTRARRRSARERVASLAAEVDLDRFSEMVVSRRMLPLLGSRLAELVDAPLPSAFSLRVAEDTERTRRTGMARDALATSLASSLERAGIPCLPLKGTRLALDLYGDLGLRSASDVDLLVGPRDLERATVITRALGYHAPASTGENRKLPDLHHALESDHLPQVELHWRVHWHETTFSEAMLRRSRLQEDGVRRAEPLDEWTALLLFFARDGFYGVRMGADVASWWDRHGAALPADWLERQIERHPELERPLRSASHVAGHLFGVASRAPEAAGRITSRVDTACRLADWAAEGDPDQSAAIISLIDLLLAPPGSLLEAVARQSRVSTFAPDEWRTRVQHVMKLALRFAYALWHVRGRRAWRPAPVQPA